MNLIIRADASAQIGTGHVMRCLALAQAWLAGGGQVAFLTGGEAPALSSMVQQESITVSPLEGQPGSAADAAQTVSLARQLRASWAVVDGYHFGADYQRRIKEAGLGLLFIDDEGRGDHYYADLVLNQNIHAHPGLYAKREVSTRLLLGPHYALLRREFWPWRSWRREGAGVARKIIVTLGGSDPDNVTGKVVQALEQVEMEGLEAVVIAGGANLYYQELERKVSGLSVSIQLRSNVTNMAKLMTWADLAITAGGSTCWETAFMGLPSLVIILAENQRPIAESLDEAGIAVNLGWHTDLSAETISHGLHRLLETPGLLEIMAVQGQKLVDGQGAVRVVQAIHAGSGVRNAGPLSWQ